jgi:hypothetical protein
MSASAILRDKWQNVTVAKLRLARLNREDSSALKAAVKGALARKRLTVEQLADEIRKHRGEQFGDRTLWRYLSPTHRLARGSAYDLVVACGRLKLAIDPALKERIYQEATPPIIILPGESAALADALVIKASEAVELSQGAARALKSALLDFLEPYERFNDTRLGGAIFFWIRSVMGKAWRLRMHQIRTANVAADGSEVEVPSLNELMDRAQREKAGSRK